MSQIKSNLKKYYNQEAEHRNFFKKQEWKLKERKAFLDFAKSENKNTLLELGAGTGNDSLFFVQNGFTVTAIDLSPEMVKRCKEKLIDAHELDYYQVATLNKKYECIWTFNSLLHIPKAELPQVLQNINSVLQQNGLFYMGVYGGKNSEGEYTNEHCAHPRFFSSYTKDTLQNVLEKYFTIISFNRYDVSRHDGNFEFQAVLMRKK